MKKNRDVWSYLNKYVTINLIKINYMRVNKYLAHHLGISRRQADVLIDQQQVRVNGKITRLGDKLESGDEICYKNLSKWVKIQPKISGTILYYKPIFTLVSRKREGAKKTIYDHLPSQYRTYKPAGRLDYMSEGLLVLSEDGDLIYSLSHPRNETEKRYIVGLQKKFSLQDIKDFQLGVHIDGYHLRPVEVFSLTDRDSQFYSFLNMDASKFWYIFVLREGRNNQIRKMCKLKGNSVFRLIRSEHGPFKLSANLKKNKIIVV